ncbi:MAG: outer membrane protein assembly factor BamD [Alphaproteobacteria bacterium CG_4_10_14_0_8_um_filter_53_9]|nr:MAG: outer membrane protein assembly factor BamD [Alphaproteobacteria bacterium CG_4_10_14_0_8_um_filter_53_9]
MKNKNLYVAILMGGLLAACASAKPEGELTGSVNELYNQAMDQMQAGKYSSAIHSFEELDRQYPYSAWATKAQLNVAYAHFLAKDYAEVIPAAERFLQLHPGHTDAPYALYLIGLSHYGRMSDVSRDQSDTADALAAFEALVERFPESSYARDAKLKITLCKDHLAGKEMEVGRYYLGQKKYLAAINRFNTVVHAYETSSQAPEALYRLVESYIALGIADEAQRAGAILGYNYPGSVWYKQAYALLVGKKLVPENAETGWWDKWVK